MPDTPRVVSVDSTALSNGPHAAERRWIAWQQRGVARDARNRRRMAALAAFVALAVAGRFVQIALGAS